MSFTLQTIKYHEKKVRLLFDTRTTSPLLMPLIWVAFQLERKSLSTQMQRISSIKAWYDFWQEKHGSTFCYAVLSNSYNLDFAINELSSFVAYIESKRRFGGAENSFIESNCKSKPISTNTINAHVASICGFLKFLTGRYLSSAYLDLSPNQVNSLRAKQILRIASTQSQLTISSNNYRDSQTDVEKFKSLTAKMMDAIMLIIRPSTKRVNSELNPWKSQGVQWRNYIMIRLLDHYGLRAGELLLLTLDSIKPNLSGGYSMIVTAPLELDPRKATNLAIKNEFSHRTLALSDHDYKFIHHYINNHRGSASHRFIFTSTWNKKNPLSYAMLRTALIDVFTQLQSFYPDAVNSDFVESIDKLTPHMFRHTWATRKLSFLIEQLKIETPGRPLRDIHLQAMDMLRSLGGWSFNSNMPSLYAKRFIHESANTANLRRIEADAENYAKSISEEIV